MPSNTFSSLVGKLKRKLPGLSRNGGIGEMLEQKDDVRNSYEKDLWPFRALTTNYEESTIHLM
jgi:hypothetical protein